MTATIINLFGGPGSGKSTTAALIFHEMKMAGYNVELVNEYAKDLVWRESHKTLRMDQLYVFAKQHHKVCMCAGEVDFIVTDSPLLLPLLYNKDPSEEFTRLVLSYIKKYQTLNYLIKRTKPYQPVGRYQTEDEARKVDVETADLLWMYEIPYSEVTVDNVWPLVKRDVEYSQELKIRSHWEAI